MRGVIMETKNGRAVLLTSGGEFVNIKNKGYSIGDKVNITSNTGRLCAMAASLVIVCAGIGSYFVPTGYVSVDINPSLMMTLNMYNRVIDVTSFNDDARVLLNKTDIKGKSAEKSLEMLINASEEIGYINDNNRDVILEVVPVIRKPDMDDITHKDVEITNEIADRETLRIAQDIGVSIAKAKAIEEYTEKSGGDMRSNAAKFNDKSVKEIRNIMLDNGNLSDKKPIDIPKPQKNENISKPPKPRENYKPQYSINNNLFPISEPKREDNIPPANQPPQNEYRLPENISVHGEDKPQEILPELNEPPHLDITQKPQDDSVVKSEPQPIGKPIQEPPIDSQPMQTEQRPQNNVSNHGDRKPQRGVSKPNEPADEDNEPTQSDEQSPDITIPSDNQPTAEQKSDIPEQSDDKPHDNPTVPDEPQRKPYEGQERPIHKPQPSEPKQENNTPPQTDIQPPNEPKREDGLRHEPKPQDGGGNNMANEGMGGHNENREMP